MKREYVIKITGLISWFEFFCLLSFKKLLKIWDRYTEQRAENGLHPDRQNNMKRRFKYESLFEEKKKDIYNQE